MELVSGYEIRRVRNADYFVLVLFGLDPETLALVSAIRTTSRDPADLLEFVESRIKNIGDVFPKERKERAVMQGRGTSDRGLVAGHCVTIDRWFGLRGWALVEMENDDGPVNVPALTHYAPWHALHQLHSGEDRESAVRNLIVSTIQMVREEYPMRSMTEVCFQNGSYRVIIDDPSEPEMGTSGGEELPA